ncbi:MAG TPA: EAL domain-containing protein [Bauldia sp.]|nr:EAL domain-containing protein [Bauldia sp.]
MSVDALTAFLEKINSGACIWDSQLRLVAWNAAYRRTQSVPDHILKRGARLATILDHGPRVLDDTRTGDETEAGALRGLSERGKLDVERVFADGRTIAVTYDAFGANHWLALYHDVTEQRNDVRLLRISERELRLQHAQLDASLDSMSYGFVIWDDELRIIVCNNEFLRMFNLPNEVRAGTTLAEVCRFSAAVGNWPNASAEQLVAIFRERITGARDPQSPKRHEIDLRGRVIRSTYARSAGIGWVATHQDVTEDAARLRELEARKDELAQQNMRFSAAVDTMAHGLCMFDANQRLVVCNAPYARIYNLPPELLVPGTLHSDILRYRFDHGIQPTGDRDAFLERHRALLERRGNATEIFELPDGRIISISHHAMPDGGWVATHQDITEQRRHEAHIHHLARHDSLTDLPNRLAFNEAMETAEQRIRRRERFAVLAVDLDHFKLVNDTLGHAIGDRVLAEASERLRACCRSGDDVSRLGGDEFAVLTGPIDSPRDAAAIAERVVQRMAEPFEVDGHSVVIGASIGIALAPDDGKTSATLLKNADLALYRAKNAGRGAYHFFESGMDAALQERRTLELGLRQAVTNREFRLVFQPIFDLRRGRISCLEALIRWHHPERGTVSPAEFIPIAEDTGLIVPIGEWVLAEACRAAAGWPQDVNVAVNMSTVQFRHPNLFNHIKTALAVSGLRADRLELEVTESLLLADVDTTITTLHQLRALGVRISMDDFGTGYSSLSYLRSFPFDKIKIDQSFVKDLSAKEDSRAIVSAVIGLGRSLGMSTTAEGVETEAQLEVVRGQGCTEVQGFLFSPPLPATAITKLFAEQAGMEEWTRTLRKSA